MVGRIEGSIVELDLPVTKATKAVQRAQSALRSEDIVDVAVVEPAPALSFPSQSSSASRSSAAVSNEAPPHPFIPGPPNGRLHDPPRPPTTRHDPLTTTTTPNEK